MEYQNSGINEKIRDSNINDYHSQLITNIRLFINEIIRD